MLNLFRRPFGGSRPRSIPLRFGDEVVVRHVLPAPTPAGSGHEPMPGLMEILEAMRADAQALLDRLNAIPAQVNTFTTSAVTTAVAAAETEHAAEIAALATSTTAVETAVTVPAPPAS